MPCGSSAVPPTHALRGMVIEREQDYREVIGFVGNPEWGNDRVVRPRGSQSLSAA